MRLRLLAFGTITLLSCAAGFAAPAAWHVWASKTNGTTVCAQVSPGEGWELRHGPFRDPHCTLPGRPGA